jgi:membrane protein DedA with SNARE-associated domain
VLWSQCAAVFAAAFADAAVPVLPAEVVVVGMAAGAHGPASSSAVVGSAAAGSFLGQLSVFALARRLAARYRARGDHPPRDATTPRASSALVAAFLPAGRLATATAAGAAQASLRRFAPVALVGALLGALWLGGLAQAAERASGGRVAPAVAVAAGVLVVVAWLPRAWRSRRARRGRARRPPGTGPPAAYSTTTERSTSPRSILWKASSTSSSPMVSETKRSRSGLP